MAEKKKKGPDGTANLIPQNRRTKEEQKRIATMGGKASGEARRAKRDMRELTRMFLESSVPKEQDTLRKLMQSLGVKSGDMTYTMGIVSAMLREAAKGNVRAATFLRDTAGYKPDDHMTIDADATVTQKGDVVIILPEIEMDDEDE